MGVGGVIGAVATGIVSVILGLADIPIALLGGLSSFYGDLLEIVAGLPAVIVSSGFSAAVPFVLEAGVAGYVVAIAIVLATLYIVEQVVSRVR